MPDSRNEVDPVFGPPATMGRFGLSNRHCKLCQVAWTSESDEGDYCWVCGRVGDMGGKSFSGTAVAYVDQPPRHLWAELGWSEEEAG